jgi:GDSL-like Lipase/Acylhydrolase family/Carbohydrate esterase 2 N-terminal
MIFKFKYFLPVIAFALSGCLFSKTAEETNNVLPAKDLLPYGRSLLVNDRLELISSAVHFGFSFEGKSCEIFDSLPEWMDHNYLQYELDGVYQKRIRISKAAKEPVRLTVASEGHHTIWIYKATEAITGPVYIQKITGKNLKSLPNSNAPLIEFIGNSITCGAAADPSEVPCGTGEYLDQHNAYYAYGPVVSRRLGVNYILSSVSGIGIYRTWNTEEPSMPKVYEKADFLVGSNRNWDYSIYNPRIVSIALGTNDLSNGDGKTPRTPFDSAKFVNAYISFVQLVKSKYPKAQIVFLNSPMVQGDRNVLLENCLTAIKKHIDNLYPADKPIALYFFKSRKGRGCTGHPNLEDHAALAEELYPFFKALLAKQ